MAASKLTKSLRNSIAAEAKSVTEQDNTTAHPPHNIETKQPAIASDVKTAVKKSITPVVKAANKTISKPVSNIAKATKTLASAGKKHRSSTVRPVNAAAKQTPLRDNQAVSLIHNKLHHIVEINYHLYETYLDNLQKVNDNLHDYLNQLIEINDINALVKLNLSYLSSAPIRYQEMLAQNKSIFSDFFKFTLPKG